MELTITLFIIVVTGLVSYQCFTHPELFHKLMHNPYAVFHKKEYSRIITHGFVHGSWPHLILNMYVLYMFGGLVEEIFSHSYALGRSYFVLLYFGGMVCATIPSMLKHRDNVNYNSVGASGAVSAVVFSSIILNPLMEMGILFIPFMIPAFIFGPLYILLEYYLDKRNSSPIAHDAHIWGALFGVGITIIIDPALIPRFINQVMGYFA